MSFDYPEPTPIPLDSEEACVAELERCSSHMAALTHEATRVEEAMAEVKDQYERMEAIAAKEVRGESDKSLTATEVKARITELVTADADLASFRENLYTLEAEQESLARRIKTLEKRGGHAQSALGKLRDQNKLTGFSGQTNYGGR